MKSLAIGYVKQVIVIFFILFEVSGIIHSLIDYSQEKARIIEICKKYNIEKDDFDMYLKQKENDVIFYFSIYTILLITTASLCIYMYKRQSRGIRNSIENFATLLVDSVKQRKSLELNEKLDYIEFKKIADPLNEILEDIYFKENHNSLTQLPKRKKFIKDSLELLDKKGLPVIVAYIHLKDYKELLKSRSFTLADKVIVELANRLKEVSKEIEDSNLAKISGDGDFLLSFPCPKYPEACYVLVSNKLHECFSKKINLGIEGSFELGIGIGFGLLNNENKEGFLDNVYKAAIISTMQKNKIYCVYTDELRLQIDIEAKLETDLKIAVEQDLLEVHYQAKISTKNGMVSGAEALVRWLRYNKFENTERFITLAEQSNLIIKLERLVISKVFKDQRWLQDNDIFMPISINISAKHLIHSSFLNTIKDNINKYNIEPKYIDIEITEREKLDSKDSIVVLKELKELGFLISIDDFGKEYSSFGYINNLPIDSIKIDKSFVDGIAEDDEIINENSKAIINAIIKIAKKINKKTVAEGVETLEQVMYLKEIGCDELQGFYYHKGAAPLNKFLEVYKNKLKKVDI